MPRYEIGYGKPPKATQFQPGQSGNKRGRPPRATSNALGEIVRGVLNGSMEFDQKGRIRKATRREVALRALVGRAVGGDVPAANLLLKKRAQAVRQAKGNAKRLRINDWLPDHPGQTAKGKADSADGPAGEAKSPDADPFRSDLSGKAS
jgi:hypothetical protein